MATRTRRDAAASVEFPLSDGLPAIAWRCGPGWRMASSTLIGGGVRGRAISLSNRCGALAAVLAAAIAALRPSRPPRL